MMLRALTLGSFIHGHAVTTTEGILSPGSGPPPAQYHRHFSGIEYIS